LIILDDSEATSLEQIRPFLAGGGEVRFAGQRRDEMYADGHQVRPGAAQLGLSRHARANRRALGATMNIGGETMAQVRKPKSHRQERIASTALANLGDLVAIRPIPSDTVALTSAERKFLDDPEWITEDEAEAIMAERIFRSEGGRGKPIRQYLKERGIRVDG
jgi:hypothetical protein